MLRPYGTAPRNRTAPCNVIAPWNGTAPRNRTAPCNVIAPWNGTAPRNTIATPSSPSLRPAPKQRIAPQRTRPYRIDMRREGLCLCGRREIFLGAGGIAKP
jgi:hypothetical protein